MAWSMKITIPCTKSKPKNQCQKRMTSKWRHLYWRVVLILEGSMGTGRIWRVQWTQLKRKSHHKTLLASTKFLVEAMNLLFQRKSKIRRGDRRWKMPILKFWWAISSHLAMPTSFMPPFYRILPDPIQDNGKEISARILCRINPWKTIHTQTSTALKLNLYRLKWKIRSRRTRKIMMMYRTILMLVSRLSRSKGDNN